MKSRYFSIERVSAADNTECDGRSRQRGSPLHSSIMSSSTHSALFNGQKENATSRVLGAKGLLRRRKPANISEIREDTHKKQDKQPQKKKKEAEREAKAKIRRVGRHS